MLGIKRGRWQPLLPPVWRSATMLTLPLTPIAVGGDYLTGEPEWWLSEIEQTMPLPLWGWLLITSGLLTIIGFVGRWRHVTIGGLHISGALMAVLGAGIAAQSLNAADGGWRWPSLYLVVAFASWCAAIGYWSQVEADGSVHGPG